MESAGRRRRERNARRQTTGDIDGLRRTSASAQDSGPGSSTAMPEQHQPGASARSRTRREENHSKDLGSNRHNTSNYDGLSLSNGFGHSSEDEPLRFTVDLSQPPSQRYDHIAPHFQRHVASLPDLFDELVASVAPSRPLVGSTLRRLARLALRRVFSSEETGELRGIAAATGVQMHLLVAFNVLLDLLLGCTSGGVRVAGEENRARMLHFRTLDWGMDPLRNVVVELDFVRRAGGPVVASCLTYFGYVGVLTGVREALSMSLNFRPHHDRSTWRNQVGFRLHQLLVIIGWRRSISSVLRDFLLAPELAGFDEGPQTNPGLEKGGGEVADALHSDSDWGLPARMMKTILAALSSSPSTAAYLIFCTPTTAFSVEKDNRAATVHVSRHFLTTCNHDAADEADPAQLDVVSHGAAEEATGMADLVRFSIDRKMRALGMWQRRVRKHRLRRRRMHLGRQGEVTDGGSAIGREQQDDGEEKEELVGYQDVLDIVTDGEISNEETHYAAIMDPTAGKILWRKLYPSPLKRL